jgi:hypothetical protein
MLPGQIRRRRGRRREGAANVEGTAASRRWLPPGYVGLVVERGGGGRGGGGLRAIGATSDRHKPVIGVVALVPSFLDRGTIIGALPSESVTTPSHVPN